MKKVLLVLALVAVSILVVSLMPAASQQPPQRNTIVVFDPNKTTFEKEIDEGRKGFSAGDWSLVLEKVKDPDSCDPAGVFQIRFTLVRLIRPEDGRFIVDFTYIRPDGRITAYGAGKFSDFEAGKPFAAVTGGTEAYRDATGQVSVEEGVTRCNQEGALLTLDIGPR